MAKDLDELLDDDNVIKGSDRTPRIPEVEGSFDVEVLTFKSPESDTKMYISEFIVEKSTHPLVLVGSKYCLMWFLEGYKGAAEMAAKKMRPFLAACVGADPSRKDFRAVDAKKDLMAITEKGSIGSKVRITGRLGAPSKKKFDENGKGKRYIEHSFDALGD